MVPRAQPDYVLAQMDDHDMTPAAEVELVLPVVIQERMGINRLRPMRVVAD